MKTVLKNFFSGKQRSEKYLGMRGFSLIEVLLGIAIFLILATSIFFTYGNVLEIIGKTRMRTLSTTLLNREIEIVRSLDYSQVGINGGFPTGVLEAQKIIVYEGQHFLVNTYVRNIDDPFDGTTGGNPDDTAPADYKLVHIIADCPTCYNFVPVEATTWVAPKGLETSSKNGSLFINVFDANGIPVSSANVQVVNNVLSPTISISDTTNASGTLKLIDVPTSTTAYEITVSKSGYTTARTYALGGSPNENPIQPHATVSTQTITSISFAIDKVSTLTTKTQNAFCGAIPSVAVHQYGTKLIGSGPDILKYDKTWSTDTSGAHVDSATEWDTYHFAITDGAYDLAGAIPELPLSIDPNTAANLSLVVVPKASSSLLVSVRSASGTLLSGATVNIQKTGTNTSVVTGERSFNETNWTGGQYTSQDGNISDNTPSGDLILVQSNGVYPTSTNSWLISNTLDVGTSTTVFKNISWNPATQPPQTGSNSVGFQLASNNDNATWNFIGPDGTGNTMYTAAAPIGNWHDGHRYMRYKAFLNTPNQNYTPSLQDVAISFSSGCIPGGAAFFSAIPTGTYTLTVTKAGYQTATSSMLVSPGWQETEITLQ